ncbi:hypothetical protein Zmor_015567 [Zophobas morio]|uniref:THAP-type domain-containing protein n=1 Tax=Zophobas morio TaxID=2755281 RepID=A0AA38IKJ2_9CUCU|nr:hypothetical protein Zmor_015567 [Zophobas morio]
MGRKCVVPNCSSGYKGNPEKVSVFRVPKDRLLEWQRAIPRKDRQLTVNDVVCAKHFNREDIVTEVTTESIENKHQQSIEILFDRLISENILKLPSKSWALHIITDQGNENKKICISMVTVIDETVEMKKSILIAKDGLKCFIFGSPFLPSTLNEVNSVQTLQTFLDYFDSLEVCYGGAKINKCPSAFQTTFYQFDRHCNVWRHIHCTYTTNRGQQCFYCKKITRALYDFQRKNKTLITTKLSSLRKKLKISNRQQNRLQTKTQRILSELKLSKEKIKRIDEESLFNKIDNLDNLPLAQKILIKECYKMTKYNKKTSRRYTSDWLLTCLLLHIRSPAAYRFLRNNDILPLPQISTVRKYLSRVSIKCGLDQQFFEAFKKKVEGKNSFQKQGILIFDEMTVRQNIELNVTNTKLIGIQDFGLEHPKTSKTADKKADHALVFLFSSLTDQEFNQPVAVYAAKGPTNGTCLAQLMIEVIRKLEYCGVVIHGIVSDGASTNRRMWKEFGITGELDNAVNKCVHPLDELRYLFFFSDAPHLVKCLRNRFLKASILQTPDGKVNWMHYKMLFDYDKNLPHNLRICPKLTQMHIQPTNFMKMRVKLATQIFSNSVADGLHYFKQKYKEFEEVDSTIKFTKRVNNLFDALNRRHPLEGIRENSKDFDTLNENLAWFNEWERMVEEGKISKSQFLTKSTTEGLRVTILSTIELCKYLLSNGFKYVLTNKMNQDPLERFFGTIRLADCANGHPTFITFLQLYRMLTVYKLLKPPKFGNCTQMQENSNANNSLSFNDFKNVFETNPECGKNHVEKIKMKIEYILDTDSPINEIDEQLFEDVTTTEIVDNSIYYLAGFVAKKLYNTSKCNICREQLYNKEDPCSSTSEFTSTKSRGWLNHPDSLMFNMFRWVEGILMKYIDFVDVFDATIEELFATKNFMTIYFPFSCEEHRLEIFSKAIYFYTIMRIKQFYKQEQEKTTKACAEKRKESRLQTT